MNVATQLIERMAAAVVDNQPKTQSSGGTSEFESLMRRQTAQPEKEQTEVGAETEKPVADEADTTQQELAAALITTQPAIPMVIVQPTQQQTAPVQLETQAPAVETQPTAAPAAQQAAAAPETNFLPNEQYTRVPVNNVTEQQQQTTAQSKAAEAPVEAPAELKAAPAQPQTENTGTQSFTADTASAKTIEVTEKNTDSDKTETAVFESVEAVPVKVGEAPLMEKTSATLDVQQPEAAEKLAQSITEAVENGDTKLEIKLSPRSLGDVTVEITRADDGSIGIVLKTATDRAAGILEQHSSNLQSLLAAGTTETVKVEVQNTTQQSMEQFLNPNDSNGRENAENQQQQQSQQEQRQSQQQTTDFISQLRLGLVDLNQPA